MRQLPGAKPKRQDWRLSGAENPAAADSYRTQVGGTFTVLLHQPPAEFHNRLEACNFDTMVFGRCTGCAQTLSRTLAHVRRDGLDHIQVVLTLNGGWSGEYDGRRVDSAMGSLRTIDMSRPFEWRGEDFQTLNLMIPRAELGEAGQADLHGLVLNEMAPGAAMLAGLMRSLWDMLDETSLVEGVAATKAVAALLVGLVVEHGAPAPPALRPYGNVLLALAADLVDGRLADPALTPEFLRRQLGVSRSALYGLFEKSGGVQTFIQSRRLDRTFEALARKTGQTTIAEIAFACGFRTASHFSRAFTSRYGVTPSQFLKLRDLSPEPPPPTKDGVDAVLNWFDRMVHA